MTKTSRASPARDASRGGSRSLAAQSDVDRERGRGLKLRGRPSPPKGAGPIPRSPFCTRVRPSGNPASPAATHWGHTTSVAGASTRTVSGEMLDTSS
jgi:hypothetical protein